MQTNFEKRNPANPCYPIHPKAILYSQKIILPIWQGVRE